MYSIKSKCITIFLQYACRLIIFFHKRLELVLQSCPRRAQLSCCYSDFIYSIIMVHSLIIESTWRARLDPHVAFTYSAVIINNIYCIISALRYPWKQRARKEPVPLLGMHIMDIHPTRFKLHLYMYMWSCSTSLGIVLRYKDYFQ